MTLKKSLNNNKNKKQQLSQFCFAAGKKGKLRTFAIARLTVWREKGKLQTFVLFFTCPFAQHAYLCSFVERMNRMALLKLLSTGGIWFVTSPLFLGTDDTLLMCLSERKHTNPFDKKNHILNANFEKERTKPLTIRKRAKCCLETTLPVAFHFEFKDLNAVPAWKSKQRQCS